MKWLCLPFIAGALAHLGLWEFYMLGMWSPPHIEALFFLTFGWVAIAICVTIVCSDC